MVKKPFTAQHPEVREASPIGVEPSNVRPIFDDYIPPPGIERGPVRREPPPLTSPVRPMPGKDYVGPDETREVEKRFKERVKEMAKSIWKQQKAQREEFARCQSIVDKASEEELANPENFPLIARALRVVKGEGPATREATVEEAKRRIRAQSEAEFGQLWID